MFASTDDSNNFLFSSPVVLKQKSFKDNFLLKFVVTNPIIVRNITIFYHYLSKDFFKFWEKYFVYFQVTCKVPLLTQSFLTFCLFICSVFIIRRKF